MWTGWVAHSRRHVAVTLAMSEGTVTSTTLLPQFAGRKQPAVVSEDTVCDTASSTASRSHTARFCKAASITVCSRPNSSALTIIRNQWAGYA